MPRRMLRSLSLFALAPVYISTSDHAYAPQSSMPASPAPYVSNTPRRPGAQSPEKKTSMPDLGKRIAQDTSPGAKQKIREWQIDGGGVKDVVTVEYEPSKRKSATPVKPSQTPQKAPTPQIAVTGMDVERKAWVRRKGKPQVELDTDVRHVGAPRKRVVSDEHWLSSRSPPKKDLAAHDSVLKRAEELVAKRAALKESVGNTGPRPPPSPRQTDDHKTGRLVPKKYVSTPALRDRARMSARRVDSEDMAATGRHYGQRRPGDSNRRGSGSDTYRDENKNTDPRRGDRRRKRDNPSHSDHEVESRLSLDTPVPDDSISRRDGTNRKEPLPRSRSPKYDNHRRSPHIDRREDSRAAIHHPPGHTHPQTPPQVFNNRLEGWLAGAYDPFTDSSKPPSLDPTSLSSPSTNARRGTSKQESPADQDDSRRRDRESEDRRERTPGKDSSIQSTPKEALHGKRASPRSPHEDSSKRSIRRSGGQRDLSDSAKRSSARLETEDPPIPAVRHTQESKPAVRSPEISPSKESPLSNTKRHFPSTGNHLSTIASVATFDPRAQAAPPPDIFEEATTIGAKRPSEQDLGRKKSSTGLKRRLTRHDDLISILSLPSEESRSLVSARSLRTTRTRLDQATIESVLEELSSDESKYQQELRTIVDGVIPVILSCVLSETDSAAAGFLFGRSAENDASITQPIIDMGVALERLKASHKRMPMKPELLLAWAHGASRIYSDYLKAWRMGFQDVVVNLAPADPSSEKSPSWDDRLPRNADGDLVNGQGERVDVAFLLKRPLVRLKHLAKTFKCIGSLLPSTEAATVADQYQQLVEEARKRSTEERARLEDMAAASIDPTRARDLRTLAPLTGVRIEQTRLLRARDYFDMHFRHSSGQQMDCKVELLFRDDAPARGSSGDVLVCEVTDNGRWLLFPPIQRSAISTSQSGTEGELVVMIRGQGAGGGEWHELLILQSDEEEAILEWISMLGQRPAPPVMPSNKVVGPRSHIKPAGAPPNAKATSPPSRVPSLQEINVPIGEQARSTSKRWSEALPFVEGSIALGITYDDELFLDAPKAQNKGTPSRVDGLTMSEAQSRSMPASPLLDSADDRGGKRTLRRTNGRRYQSNPTSPVSNSSPQLPSQPEYYYESLRHKASADRPSPYSSEPSSTALDTVTSSRKNQSDWTAAPEQTSDKLYDTQDAYAPVLASTERPRFQRRTSSVPGMSMPSVAKRDSPQPSTPTAQTDSPRVPGRTTSYGPESSPASTPSKLQKRIPSAEKAKAGHEVVQTPPQSSQTPTKPKTGFMSSFTTPAFLRRAPRPSSPLKREYEPSISSDGDSGSEYSDKDGDDVSITSGYSDEDSDHFSNAKSPGLDVLNTYEKPTPPLSALSDPSNDTLSPSQSASQGPYRAVPQQAGKASRVVAAIFSWSETGTWESLHPQDCSVIVTPGMIEAFDMSTIHSMPQTFFQDGLSSPSASGVKPLVALELTPLVPLRRGTAVDISIRSPPTPNSLIRSSNNVMFRSRSPEECEELYYLINHARINNPTYVALQNARGPYSQGTWAAAMERRNNLRTSASATGSWWQLSPSRRSSTYRSKTASRAPSLAATESSVGTMNTAFSALRRFSSGARLFNLAKSSVTSSSRRDTSTNSESQLSTGGGRGGRGDNGDAAFPPLDPALGTPLGLANVKIRLYVRETASKWRDMGAARLAILLPPRPSLSPAGMPGQPKRILVRGATKGEMLLDVTLGESAFERVARTGIAVSVWEEATGPNGEVGQVAAVGGVSSSRARVFMIQMKSERDCAYTFGLVGKLRY